MTQTIHQHTNAAISNDSSVLHSIHLKSKNIAIYQRDMVSLKGDLHQIAEQSIECRVSGTIEEILIGLKNYFDNNLSERNALLNDVTELLNLFEQLTRASTFRLLLASVSTNMCRRFHTDINDLRMLCTYIGQGTLWLPSEAINQRAVAKGSNEEIVLDEKLIQQANTGDVVILKGALYEGANPILHRSPSIEANGERRLLLRIDTNDFINSLS
ncbi:MAG: DUF1826 domain-containing protein [Bacteroidota bacterium]